MYKSLLSLAVFAGVLSFTACKKSDDPAPAPAPKVRVAAVHTIPAGSAAIPPAVTSTPAVTIRANATTSVFAGLGYNSSLSIVNSNYTSVDAGSLRLSAVNAVNNNPIIADTEVNLEADKSYTAFATGLVGQTGALAPGFYVLTDDLSAPTTGNVKIRFLHLAPNVPTVDVYIFPLGTTTPATPTLTSKAFKEAPSTASAFTQIAAGNYRFEVRAAGAASTTTPLVAISATLGAGKAYTIYARGTTAFSSGAFAPGASIIVHN